MSGRSPKDIFSSTDIDAEPWNSWDPESGNVERVDYFAKKPDGKEYNFINDFWKRMSPLSLLSRCCGMIQADKECFSAL